MKISIVNSFAVFVIGNALLLSNAYCGDTHVFNEPRIAGSRIFVQYSDYTDPEKFCKRKGYDFSRDTDVIMVDDCGKTSNRCMSIDFKDKCVSTEMQCRIYLNITCGKD